MVDSQAKVQEIVKETINEEKANKRLWIGVVALAVLTWLLVIATIASCLNNACTS